MKKLSLLLASIGAGLLLVGGTVAAYIVTTADPVNVRVSPGTISTDQYGRVILGWGDNHMATVQNLDSETETSVGSIRLTADLTKPINDDTNYTGLFTASVTNSYVGEYPLQDYLQFRFYMNSKTTPESKYVGYQAPETDAVYEQSFPAKGDDVFTVKVILKASAGDEFYPDLLDQAVSLTLTWGAGTGDYNAASMANVYYSYNLGANESLYAHIYEGSKVVASYPGIKMEPEFVIDEGGVEKQLYSAPFDKEQFTHFKFIKASVDDKDNVSYTELDSGVLNFDAIPAPNTPYYKHGEGWTTRPNEKVFVYYVRGVIGGQDYWGQSKQVYGFRPNSTKPAEFIINNLILVDGDEFKIYVQANGEYFAPGGENYEIKSTNTGNGAPGNYSIYVTADEGTKGEGWATCVGDKSNTYYMYALNTTPPTI